MEKIKDYDKVYTLLSKMLGKYHNFVYISSYYAIVSICSFFFRLAYEFFRRLC